MIGEYSAVRFSQVSRHCDLSSFRVIHQEGVWEALAVNTYKRFGQRLTALTASCIDYRASLENPPPLRPLSRRPPEGSRNTSISFGTIYSPNSVFPPWTVGKKGRSESNGSSAINSCAPNKEHLLGYLIVAAASIIVLAAKQMHLSSLDRSYHKITCASKKGIRSIGCTHATNDDCTVQYRTFLNNGLSSIPWLHCVQVKTTGLWHLLGPPCCGFEIRKAVPVRIFQTGHVYVMRRSRRRVRVWTWCVRVRIPVRPIFNPNTRMHLRPPPPFGKVALYS